MYVTNNQVIGTVAMWAVRQSPYPGGPHDLTMVLQRLERDIREDFSVGGMMKKFDDWRDVEKYLSPKLRSIPEYMGWNERRNGNNAAFKFVSRYDGPGDPDNDFIDLDALERNVAMSIEREEEDVEDGRTSILMRRTSITAPADTNCEQT